MREPAGALLRARAGRGAARRNQHTPLRPQVSPYKGIVHPHIGGEVQPLLFCHLTSHVRKIW